MISGCAMQPASALREFAQGLNIRGAIRAMKDERALLTIAVIALVLLSLLLVGLVVVWTSR
jgi:hypothetical protein